MKTVWRIVKPYHVAQAFSGEGARLYGGRWNSKGRSLVYAAESKALAALELLVHVDRAELLDSYLCIPLHFDRKWLRVLDPKTLPQEWRNHPPPRSIQQIGDQWAALNTSPVLEVPSVPIPGEKKYLINPNHPEFNQLQIGLPELFEFDLRMFIQGDES